MSRTGLIGLIGISLLAPAVRSAAAASEGAAVWKDNAVRMSLRLPDGDKTAAQLVQGTFTRHLHDFYGIDLPPSQDSSASGLQILVGTPENNAALAELTGDGVRLTQDELGDEGFQIVSAGSPEAPRLVIYGKTPQALKYGCQELIFFHLRASQRSGFVDWPLNVVMKPQIHYRGIYMLPIWSAYDSIDSWKRVLRFNSELTLNRNWFWLDGFPVAGHPASSHGTNWHFERTPLASDETVQSLIDLVNSEAMKFYIGGGWLSWHHWEVVGQDREKARQYYFDYLKTFKGVAGFYFEPTGEGTELADWLPGDSLRMMIEDLLKQDPRFEVAVAIGRFNNREYLELMSHLNPQQVYWWWCWGDPQADKALELYPRVLGWHTTTRMSDMHGTVAPPSVLDLKLAGMTTSYDPGMGYGNPWNGWPRMGVLEPRNFDPYTMPYFSHEYRFRERCWNPTMSDEQFAQRLGVRLFDADMPPESISLYLKLADLCFAPATAEKPYLEKLGAFVACYEHYGTPRNRDTIQRMAEAVRGLQELAEAR